MILQLTPGIAGQKKQIIFDRLVNRRFSVKEVQVQSGTYLIAMGDEASDIREFGCLEGVMTIDRVTDNFKLVSASRKPEASLVRIGKHTIGDGSCTLIAGPCAIENEAQAEAVVQHLVSQGITIMRGGVFKPRSSPYAFRGLGLQGLRLFHEIARKHHISVITEVMEPAQIEMMYDYVDAFQVGARNSQNFSLLDALGKVDKPVLLKRGISGRIEELLQSAEYVFCGGNECILLCERGIRTFENAYRNTFDINAIPLLKEKSHLPVIADPSHGVGIRSVVPAVALAAVVAGADGVLFEIHPQPENALSDGQQSLNFGESAALVRKIRKLVSALADDAAAPEVSQAVLEMAPRL